VVMKSIIFWDMTPCSLLSLNRRFGGTYHLHLQDRKNRFRKPASKPISSTLKMEAICPSGTSVETQRTTRLHIPEDDNLQDHIKFGNAYTIQYRMYYLLVCYLKSKHCTGVKFGPQIKRRASRGLLGTGF
jgi:hypothetical protein